MEAVEAHGGQSIRRHEAPSVCRTVPNRAVLLAIFLVTVLMSCAVLCRAVGLQFGLQTPASA